VILRPRSLFGRTAISISLTLVAFMIIAVSAAAYFIYIPLAQRYADDFSAVIVSAAHSLQSLPEEMHPELQQQLLNDHGLIVAQQLTELSEDYSEVTFYPFFRESLARRAGEGLLIHASNKDSFIWVDVPAHAKMYRLGFDSGRLGTNPPVFLLFVVFGGALLTLLASLIEVRRVVRPLDRLSAAAQKLGQGLSPLPLPEEGPAEISGLAKSFNKTTSDLRQLSENRSVMLAGISHDLRTPLTRLGLAVELLGDDSNPALIASIRRNLITMNELIEQFLKLSEGIEEKLLVQLDLWKVIESLASDVEREGSELRLCRNDPPCVYYCDPVALERVLSNLLKNAAQYGDGKPIDVSLNCNEKEVAIEICDRGSGIPPEEVEAVFRPFHRLEAGRNRRAGGSGLGLAIANQLAVKQGWEIALLPRDGGGTVAKLSLPRSHRFGLCSSSC
jgi:two-component system osmolarity sensor histidine kinase EnvZ